MCTVSMVAQDWSDRWRDRLPRDFPFNQTAPTHPPFTITTTASDISRAEFDALKKEVESLKKLLIAAKKYDEETGQHDCEDAEKTALFRNLAKMLGVDLSDVFPQAAQ